MKVKSEARDVGISPKKVVPVVKVVRGRDVNDALTLLQFMTTPTAKAVAKAIRSAVANAENVLHLSAENLKVSEIYANDGHTMKRWRPQARGRVSPILKRSTNIRVFVEEK